MNEIEKQLENVKNERENLYIELNNTHDKFAKSLLNGEGEKIKAEINKPIKINKKDKFFYKIKRFINKIINTIS